MSTIFEGEKNRQKTLDRAAGALKFCMSTKLGINISEKLVRLICAFILGRDDREEIVIKNAERKFLSAQGLIFDSV